MLSVLTPAKINLFLNIRPRRADGFHEICSVMQAVQLWDRLDVEPCEDEEPELHFSCNLPALEQDPESNLVVRAYRLFWKEAGLPPLGLKVHLEKDIPMQAGLGGGSSDAAAILVLLNHLSHAGLSPTRLRAVGAKIGSDVPFFIQGGLALVGGRGEIVEPMPTNLTAELPLVIIKPLSLHIETATAYRRVAEAGRYEAKSPDHLLSALKTLSQNPHRQATELESYLVNDFEKILFAQYPPLAETVQRMKEVGIQRPLLSGSGSALIGFAQPTAERCKAVSDAFPKSQYEVHWTRTHTGGLTQVAQPAELSAPMS